MKTYITTITVAILLFITNSAIARDTLSIVGSSTVFPFSTIVAEKFGKSTDFKVPVVESTGSGGGMKLFCKGIGTNTPDITNSSRAIKSSEVELCASNGVTPIERLIGFDGIVFANSNSSTQFSLTKEEIFKAVAHKVLSDGKWVDNDYLYWDNINSNLPHIKINVMVPPPSSGTRDAFVELVLHSVCKKIYDMPKKGDDGYKARCSGLREDGLVTEMGENDNLIVEKLTKDTARFGVFGFSFLDQNRDKVQGAIVDGVEPSFDSIADGSYKVSRPLFYYLKKEHIGIIPGILEFDEYFKALTVVDGPLEEAGLITIE